MSSDPKKPFDAPPSSTPDLLQRDMNLDRRTRAPEAVDAQPTQPVKKPNIPPNLAPRAKPAEPEMWQVQAPEDVATPIESRQPAAAARTRLEESIDEIGPEAFEPTVVRQAPTAPEERTRIETAPRAPPSPTDFAQQRSTEAALPPIRAAVPHATKPPMNTPRAPLPRTSTSDALRAPPAMAASAAPRTPQSALPATPRVAPPSPTDSAHGARPPMQPPVGARPAAPRTATSPEAIRAQGGPVPRTATSPEAIRAQVPRAATESSHGGPLPRAQTSPEALRAHTPRAPADAAPGVVAPRTPTSEAVRAQVPRATDSSHGVVAPPRAPGATDSAQGAPAPRTQTSPEAVRAQPARVAPPSPAAPRAAAPAPRAPVRTDVSTDSLLAARPTQAHEAIPEGTEPQYASPLAPISTRTEVQYGSPVAPIPQRTEVQYPSPVAAEPKKAARPAPQAQRDDVVTAEPASLWRRLGAWLTDLLFVGVTVLGLLVLAMEVIAPKNLTPMKQLAAIAIPGLALAAILAFVYTALFAFLWDGRTPGRRLLGIHLVTPSGESPGPIRALVRAALSLVSFALFLSGFWLALFDRHGQTLHDKLTRTFVVKLQDA